MSYMCIRDSNNLLMAYTHIGHNCELGNRIVLSNSVQVAGHVKIEDKAIIGGCLGIHPVSYTHLTLPTTEAV